MTTASFRLQLHSAQQEQIDPEHGHKVPVNGRVLKKGAAQHGMTGSEAARKIDESGEAGKHVKRVDERKQVKERTVGVRREVDALSAEIAPGRQLANAEGQTEKQGERHPGTGPARVVRREGRGGG